MSAPLPRLYLISDATRLGASRCVEIAAAAAAAGLRMMQVREPAWPFDRLADFAARLRAAVGDEMRLMLNARSKGEDGDVDFDRMDAWLHDGPGRGVHLGRCAPDRVGDARKRLGADTIIGYSAHTSAEVDRAFRLGADYVSFSPVFAPLSKASSLAPHGIDGLRAACAPRSGAVYALGGLTGKRARRAREAGAHGVAVIGAVSDAADPGAATRALLEMLR